MEKKITSKDIRDFRMKHKLTLDQLAGNINVNRQTLHRWEVGNLPTVKTAGFQALQDKLSTPVIQEPSQ